MINNEIITIGANTGTFVRILWTGGFDSSFRMIQLSRMNVTIQPYYLSDNRASENNELTAIQEITSDIVSHPGTKCTILPLIKLDVSDVEPDEEITKAYQRLREETAIGSQYDWLARFAKTVPNLELCLEKAESSKAYNCIKRFGSLKRIADGEVAYYIIDKNKSTNDLMNIFS